MNFRLFSITILFLVIGTLAQEYDEESPCPEVFTYVNLTYGPNKWHGELNLVSGFTLNGLWIRVIFDKPVIYLETDFGDIRTEDDISFLIKNPDHVLKTDIPVTIPITVTYDPQEAPPKIKTIRLNARDVCPGEDRRLGYSSCPGLFFYNEDQKENALNSELKWYGTLKLVSDYELNGVWIRINFNRPLEVLGSKFGEVKSKDNNGYLIFNRHHILKPGKPLLIPIYVKFNIVEATKVPYIYSIRLNGRTICAPYEDGGDHTNLNYVTSTTPKIILEEKPEKPSAKSIPDVPVSKVRIGGDIDLSSFLVDDEDGDDDNYRCGVLDFVDRIYSAQDTSISEYPWHGSLFLNDNYACGGTLITRYHILTAAHCFYESRTRLNDSAFHFKFGISSLNELRSSDLQVTEIDKVYVHGEYSFRKPNFDIAIVKLKRPIKVTETVRPICLWDGSSSLYPVENKYGTVVSFGSTEDLKLSDNLQKARLLVVESEVCRAVRPTYYLDLLNPNSFCAGNLRKQTVCRGDSGSGLYFQKPGTDIWQIRGIVSTTKLADNSLYCDRDVYAIFTDVAKFKNWIQAQLRK